MEMNISPDIRYIGVDDLDIDLFENQYIVPEGMSYNSWLIADSQVAILDTADARLAEEWKRHLTQALADRQPDYLVVHHMEPDHASLVAWAMEQYPAMQIVCSTQAAKMLPQFFDGIKTDGRVRIVKEGDTLCLGQHTLRFIGAPMVHWPEVLMSYEEKSGTLFSADAFGKFGALQNETDDWACEARRYYFNICGKYGTQVKNVLKKATSPCPQAICPLHGPVLTENLGYYLNLYNTWSSYQPEEDGVVIAYTSVYGHTKEAVDLLADKLRAKGCPNVILHDLARADMAEAVEDAFRYSKLVLATITYNAGIFPFMRDFIEHLTDRNYQNRTVAFMENGSWAPTAAKGMKALLENSKKLTFAENTVRILSALSDDSRAQIEALADELCKTHTA